MEQKDFYPYKVISETAEVVQLELPKGRKASVFCTFRVLPIVLLAFAVTIPEKLSS
ncbi:MAG: hypothetical protein LC128_05385 [Chitinophagales bacterium]|nr:hypothetical protein [Chitinophagales bacterium]